MYPVGIIQGASNDARMLLLVVPRKLLWEPRRLSTTSCCALVWKACGYVSNLVQLGYLMIKHGICLSCLNQRVGPACRATDPDLSSRCVISKETTFKHRCVLHMSSLDLDIVCCLTIMAQNVIWLSDAVRLWLISVTLWQGLWVAALATGLLVVASGAPWVHWTHHWVFDNQFSSGMYSRELCMIK